MLEIKPIQSKEIQKSLSALSSSEYREDAFAYSAYDGETFLGISQFIIDDGYAKILNISCADGTADLEAMFIMGRAVLNFLDLCHVKTVRIDKAAAETRLIRAIGFSELENGEYADLSLCGMFEAKCSNHHKTNKNS